MYLRTLLSLTFVVAVPMSANANADADEPDAKVATDLQARLKVAIELPTLTYEARVAGVAEEDVAAAVQACKVHEEVGAVETVEVFKATLTDVQANGPVEDFGAFVNAKLNEGLRGKALAAAIRKEHKARGVGKGKKLGHFEDKLHRKDGKLVFVNKGAGPGGEPGRAVGHGGVPPGRAVGHDGHPPGRAGDLTAKDHHPPGLPRPDDPRHDKVVDHGVPRPDQMDAKDKAKKDKTPEKHQNKAKGAKGGAKGEAKGHDKH